MTKTKGAQGVNRPAQPPPPSPVAAVPAEVAPLFRKIDWLAMVITFTVVGVMYLLTVAPELTLEDSGELVTGSMYAGIPHPPGYPVWTIYSWLWTALVPVGNPAWRVALGEAFLGSLACGLLSLMVSRGSSMFVESIESLKNMTGKWESAICMVSGFVAGTLMGLDGFMWRESVAVNRIAVTSVPWFLIVLLCILRWLYAPHQRRFLYWALFVFGICMTTHQSLIVAAIGVEVAIAAGNPRLGREVFFWNFLIFLLYNINTAVTGQHVFSNIGAKPGLLFIFNVVGWGSLVASCWLAIQTKIKAIEAGRELALLTTFACAALALLYRGNSDRFFLFMVASIGALGLFIYLAWKTWRLSREWLYVIILGLLWFLGASFYLYMAVSGMTNPPMQWGYPRTVDGFFHALSRGQYEQPSPTDVLADPNRFLAQLGMLISSAAEEFTWVYLLIAVVPFVFFFKMQKRERAWLIGLSAIYFFLGVLLMILLNPSPDRASADLVKVFFNNSHSIVAALIGYGLALTAAFMATHYRQFRLWGLAGGVAAVVLAFYTLWDITGKHCFGPAGWPGIGESFSQGPHEIAHAFAVNQYGLPIFAGLVLVVVPSLFVLALLVYRQRGPLLITLGLFVAMPLFSGLAHWYGSDQRHHWFGYWFGHDMFTPPFNDKEGKSLYPEMTKDAVLYGGTDPGRFCPTYMIFCESFTPHNCQPALDQKFDRRDVYIITQNALADGTYLDYIRAHYNRSKQIDPPFFQELVRSADEKKFNYETNRLARLVSPLDTIFESNGARVEERRRTYTSWFADKDFTDLPALAARLRPSPGQDSLSRYLYDNLSPDTQHLIESGSTDLALRRGLAKDLNVLLERELGVTQRLAAAQQEASELQQQTSGGDISDRMRRRQQELTREIAKLSKIGPLYDPTRFKQVSISEYLQDFIAQNPQSNTRIRLNRLLLEAAYPKEIAPSLGGVYPDREIYIATPEDSQQCFNEYLADAGARAQHDAQFPNEPKQIKPGEDVHFQDGKVSVAGQVAVMAINGLLTKVMFEHNPKNEFFVEESFPLDWMYPYLTPYGVIMKINRQPLPALTEDNLQRDHDFWKQYSKRLTGDFVDYDTPLTNITQWIEQRYLRRDLTGFTGDRKFIFDDDAQKAFSKLRSSIAGVYAWRLGPQCPPEYRPKTPAEAQRLLKEAEFAFRQAFLFCPYSPEALFRYYNLLVQQNPPRFDDALLVARTCLKLDPDNENVKGLVKSIEGYQASQGNMDQFRSSVQLLENEVRAHPTNFIAAIQLADACLQMQQPPRAIEILDGVVNNPQVTPSPLIRAIQLYARLGNWQKLEPAIEKLTRLSPDSPEAWYDLAGLKTSIGKTREALPALSRALELSAKRRQLNPKAPDLLATARQDPRFASLRQTPEFQKLVPPE